MTEKASILMPCSQLNTPAAQKLLSVVGTVYGEPCIIELDTPETLSEEVLKTQSGIVIVAVTKQIYLKTKLSFFKASGVKIAVSKALIDAMGDKAPENEKGRNLMAAIPVGAKVYAGKNGFFSAFSFVKDGKQFVFLTLDEENFSSTVSAAFGGGNTEETNFRKSIDAVTESGKKIAVAPCGSSQAVMKLLHGIGAEKTFVLSDKAEKQSPRTEKEFALSAKNAMEWCLADYGAAMSGILRDEETGEKYIAVFLADADGAQVAKVYADGDETDTRLAVAAFIRLCSMMEKAALKKDDKTAKAPLLPILIAALGIILAVVFCFAAMTAQGKNENNESSQTVAAVEDGGRSVQSEQ